MKLFCLGFFGMQCSSVWYAVFKIVKGHLKLSSAFSGDSGNGCSISVDTVGNEFQLPKDGGGEKEKVL